MEYMNFMQFCEYLRAFNMRPELQITNTQLVILHFTLSPATSSILSGAFEKRLKMMQVRIITLPLSLRKKTKLLSIAHSTRDKCDDFRGTKFVNFIRAWWSHQKRKVNEKELKNQLKMQVFAKIETQQQNEWKFYFDLSCLVIDRHPINGCLMHVMSTSLPFVSLSINMDHSYISREKNDWSHCSQMIERKATTQRIINIVWMSWKPTIIDW